MISKKIVESARFLKMPPSAQNLYFHLVLNTDDDGVVEAYPVLNMINANPDDLNILASKELIKLLNEDLVSYIVDFKKMNTLRADRKQDSEYQDLLKAEVPNVILLEKKERADLKKKKGNAVGGLSMDEQRTAQGSVEEDSIAELSIGENSVVSGDTSEILYRLDTQTISKNQYDSLINQFGKFTVDSVIKRILSRPYHGMLEMQRKK